MTTPTARSTTLPRSRNFLKPPISARASCSTAPLPLRRSGTATSVMYLRSYETCRTAHATASDACEGISRLHSSSADPQYRTPLTEFVTMSDVLGSELLLQRR